jgi:hypothetical protein
MKKILLLITGLTIISCGASDDLDGEGNPLTYYEEGPIVEINNERLSVAFAQLRLIEWGATQINTRKLDTITHLDFRGTNPEILNHLPNITSISFLKALPNKQSYLDAFRILENTNRLSKLDSLEISLGFASAEEEYFGDDYYYDYLSNTSGKFWKSLPNIKKLIFRGGIPWGLQTEDMPLLEHIEIEDGTCPANSLYTRKKTNLYYQSDFKITIISPEKKIRKISLPLCAGIRNLENLVNLEYLVTHNPLFPKNINLSRLTKLKTLWFGYLGCDDCVIVSQQQLDDLPSNNWRDLTTLERKDCVYNCTLFGGGYCRVNYRHLYQVGECRTLCEEDPYAGGNGDCN